MADQNQNASGDISPVTPKPETENRPHDQSSEGEELADVVVEERSRPGVPAATLGDLLVSSFEDGQRRNNARQFLRLAGIWANDLHSQIRSAKEEIAQLRAEIARLNEDLARKREQLAASVGAAKSRKTNKPLLALTLIGGPILLEVGLHLMAHQDIGLGAVVGIIGVGLVVAAVFVGLDSGGPHA